MPLLMAENHTHILLTTITAVHSYTACTRLSGDAASHRLYFPAREKYITKRGIPPCCTTVDGCAQLSLSTYTTVNGAEHFFLLHTTTV